ncbi:MAG: hypothetical protein JKY55_04970 [Aliivibrio sp.]|uniref:hypothetical protein n=1 Tax=Aliivibrio sp. TaxID=1872443 RepID=UPI001A4AF6E7|nr:hypothetical protein [Aliivibrio sp.]
MKGKGLLFITAFMSFNLMSADYFIDRAIIGIGAYSSGDFSVLFINVDGDKRSMASCATTERFAISSTAANYKEMVTLAMTAYAAKDKHVELIVSDTCNHWGNSQDVLGIKVGEITWSL